MQNLFKDDSPFFCGITWIADLIIINLLTIIFSVPVLTAGASILAAFSTIRDLDRGMGSSTIHTYFYHWKKDFWEASKLFGVFLLPVVLGIASTYFVFSSHHMVSLSKKVILSAYAIITSGIMVLSFVLFSNFENTLRMTILNAMKIGLLTLPKTLLSVLLISFPLIAFLVSPDIFLFMFIFFLLFGISFPIFCIYRLYKPVMKKISEKEK